MIVSSNDDTNAVLVFEGLELKTLHLIIEKMTTEQAMQVAAELHDAGFNADETDVKAYARVFTNITHNITEAVNKRRCVSCGDIHDDDDDSSEPPVM